MLDSYEEIVNSILIEYTARPECLINRNKVEGKTRLIGPWAWISKILVFWWWLLRDLRTNVCLGPRSRVSGKDTTEDAEECGVSQELMNICTGCSIFTMFSSIRSGVNEMKCLPLNYMSNVGLGTLFQRGLVSFCLKWDPPMLLLLPNSSRRHRRELI